MQSVLRPLCPREPNSALTLAPLSSLQSARVHSFNRRLIATVNERGQTKVSLERPPPRRPRESSPNGASEEHLFVRALIYLAILFTTLTVAFIVCRNAFRRSLRRIARRPCTKQSGHLSVRNRSPKIEINPFHSATMQLRLV